MKNLILSLFIILSASAYASKVDTASFSVSGVCGMCKDRIENAAYIKGVKKATWDKEEQILTVIYKPNKVTLKQIGESLAEAGHDNEHATSTDEQYMKVHKCCRYREEEVH